MNCIYCNNPMNDFPKSSSLISVLSCEFCPNFTSFVYSNPLALLAMPPAGPTLLQITFWADDIEIEISISNNDLSLYEKEKAICRINYIPDINPSNAIFWKDKLIKMKAFL